MTPDVAVLGGAAHRTPALTWEPAPVTPRLAPGETHLWRVPTLPGDDGPAWTVLADAERHRALSYADERAARGFVKARAGLRAILAGYVGCEPEDVEFEAGVGGRPSVRGAHPDMDFSASRVEGTSVIAVTAGGKVGIDAERISAVAAHGSPPWSFVREQAPPGLVDDLGDEGDRAFCIAWTRLEAYAKACTNGLGGSDTGTGRCHVRSFVLTADLVCSLAEAGAQPRALRTFDLGRAAVA